MIQVYFTFISVSCFFILKQKKSIWAIELKKIFVGCLGVSYVFSRDTPSRNIKNF
jgi:hypothetical protein